MEDSIKPMTEPVNLAEDLQLDTHTLPPALSHTKQDESDWLSFDQIPLTLVDERHYTQVMGESILASLVLFTLLSLFIILVATVPLLIALPILSALALVLSTISYFRYAHAKSIGYGVCDNELLMQKGVIWFKRISLPYTRLQHISLSQGPIERKFGLHTLKCFSAGSGSAEIELPGLESRTAEKLRQHLLAKAGIASETTNSQLVQESLPEALTPSEETSFTQAQEAKPETSAPITSESER
ncbi:PH domain-containing protein [Shewanella eurypsychrophilus]|uniref:PH domain-containing protein n=1 Tax=Shewanella eurypsychrophilus TaxID=2593656 RepID=A0ABX6V9Z0_9GAMM|nr:MULTISPECIES: PH domain-containing protein [Shewanella]QFU24231.1 PH domain-containing protein [Shewanella sp. YLB-09]QPG59436.1 PH domain-containing protein [Shewanella eurypsychrophilus]